MDAPKHIKCLNEGRTGQYYRIAGSNNYKCKSCGEVVNGRVFEPIEYSWKEEPDKWASWIGDRANKEVVSKIVENSKSLSINK